jgi:hypothetical protein
VINRTNIAGTTRRRKEEGVVSEQNRSWWDKLFGSSYDNERETKVREYIVHRVGEGAHLRDVLHEEYVQRNASQDEVEEILADPALIEATHEQLRNDFSSKKLDPTPPPSAAQ